VTETVLWLFAAVLILAVLRSIIGIVLKGVAEFFRAASSQPSSQSSGPGAPSRPAPRTGTLPTAEALKKDPVCGTFIAPSTAVRKTVNGENYYFCSAECRDRFKG
jgi:YHS domain-containing protein